MIELSGTLRTLELVTSAVTAPAVLGSSVPPRTAAPSVPPVPPSVSASDGGQHGGVSGVDCSDPGSVLGELFCPPSSPYAWLAALSGWLWRMLTGWWPLITVGAVMALLTGALLAVAIGRARALAAERARWVEITPPARVPVDGAAMLWRGLTMLLARTHPQAARRRLVGVGWWVRRFVPRTLDRKSVV